VSKDLKAAVYSGGSSDTAKAPSYLRTFFNFSRFFLATRPVSSVRLEGQTTNKQSSEKVQGTKIITIIKYLTASTGGSERQFTSSHSKIDCYADRKPDWQTDMRGLEDRIRNSQTFKLRNLQKSRVTAWTGGQNNRLASRRGRRQVGSSC
jgi:hypothetical protein